MTFQNLRSDKDWRVEIDVGTSAQFDFMHLFQNVTTSTNLKIIWPFVCFEQLRKDVLLN